MIWNHSSKTKWRFSVFSLQSSRIFIVLQMKHPLCCFVMRAHFIFDLMKWNIFRVIGSVSCDLSWFLIVILFSLFDSIQLSQMTYTDSVTSIKMKSNLRSELFWWLKNKMEIKYEMKIKWNMKPQIREENKRKGKRNCLWLQWHSLTEQRLFYLFISLNMNLYWF